ncbi:g11054 [Coccomyxa viridis]|uniref:G11054 protein n=1 Tax=Coccomyxa viridis TaxID=1274662 RepID=A0ABP1G9Q7_9CHLO
MCRIELAAAYRVFALKGWNDNVIVSAPMLAPVFLHYDEITASSLLTITEDGDVINPGVVGDIFGVNKAGFIIHSALHRARPDVRSVMHSHYAPAAGVSAQRDGLKELAQTIHLLGPIAYHDYEGIVVDPAEEERLVADVGESNTVFLRNHDVNTLGNSVGAALIQMDQLMLACELQTAAEAAGTDNLLTPPIDTIEKTYEVTRTFTGSAGFGIMEFCAMMRHLDKLDDSYRL